MPYESTNLRNVGKHVQGQGTVDDYTNLNEKTHIKGKEAGETHLLAEP